jgi:hypothetical protein
MYAGYSGNNHVCVGCIRAKRVCTWVDSKVNHAHFFGGHKQVGTGWQVTSLGCIGGLQ